LLHSYHHPLAVDIAHLKACRFAYPEACRIGDHKYRPVLEILHDGK
jgi:hypothetical protein